EGGAVPREYIGAVESGVKDAMASGALAGYPMTDVKASLYDGSFHEVDSSDLAFRIAGSMALREGAKKAGPVLLEPIVKMEVATPEEFLGDIIGDLNSRRGHVTSIEPHSAVRIIHCLVPLAETFGYATDLRSISQGRANYSMEFYRYEEAPRGLAEQITVKVGGA
ncbi:MAG: elongation factor G, partial [Chloroflexota bacterium]|nr:elongation factor G [Chloroflexota bacterium]